MSNDPILDAFAAHRARRPDRLLVISALAAATAGEIDAQAQGLAGRLAALGLAEGSLVMLSAPNGPAFLAGFLAARRARLVPVLCDAAMPAAERAGAGRALAAAGEIACPTGWPESLDDWRIAAVAGARGGSPSRPLAAEPTRESAEAGGDEGAASAAQARATAPPEVPDLPGLAAVKLTSGTTGQPRGVAVTGEALLADEDQLHRTMGLAGHQRYLAALPLSHSYGLSSLALPALARGVTLVVPQDRSPLAPVAAARTGEISFLPTVPAFLGALTRLAEPPPLPGCVRLVISAGAPLPAAVAARFRELYGRAVQVFYGASESGGICFDRAGGAAERGTVGTPVEGVAVTLDPEDGRVEVRSAAVALGHLPTSSPDLAGGRFRAGDLGCFRADGELELGGRVDDLLKIKGKYVNPREIEAVLADLPGVSEVAVLVLPGDTATGPLLRAAIAAPAGALGYEQVQAWCRARLADHKVPRSVLFVAELPRTERGKLDRAALAALPAAG